MNSLGVDKEWAERYARVTNTPTYKLVEKIVLTLKYLDKIKRDIAELNAELANAQRTARIELGNFLPKLNDHVAMPLRVDVDGDVLSIESEWYDFNDPLEAVTLKVAEKIPGLFSLAEATHPSDLKPLEAAT